MRFLTYWPNWTAFTVVAALVLGAAVFLSGTAEAQSATLVGAGDIAGGSWTQDSATATLVQARVSAGAQAYTLGDNVYVDGTASEFANYYAPTWGQFRAKTWPIPGNHEYHTPGAAGYKDYFGALAQPYGATYYRKVVNGWSVYMLDSEIPVAIGSTQYAWLRNQLAAEPNAGCSLAMFHKPVISSGQHGSDPTMKAAFKLMDAEGVELTLAGHDHHYERYSKLGVNSTNQVVYSATGTRHVIVGTGGTPLRAFGTIQPNSLVRQNTVHGVLQLTLNAADYSGRFVPVAGKTFSESFAGVCEA